MVDMKARPLCQPTSDLRMLVGGVVVDHQMNLEIGRHVAVDMLQKGQKLLVPVARATLGEHPTVGDVERGKQGCRAMSKVIVVNAIDIAEAKRQDRLVRSSAWIWLFSSTHNTTACSGGLR